MSEARINGIFEPTKETQFGFPVYKKKADNGETWVEMVFKDEGWRWHLKCTASKGKDSLDCFAYCLLKETDVKLPQDCDRWHVQKANDTFVEQSNLQVSLVTAGSLPAEVSSRFQEGLAIVKHKRDERIAAVSTSQLSKQLTDALVIRILIILHLLSFSHHLNHMTSSILSLDDHSGKEN